MLVTRLDTRCSTAQDLATAARRKQALGEIDKDTETKISPIARELRVVGQLAGNAPMVKINPRPSVDSSRLQGLLR